MVLEHGREKAMVVVVVANLLFVVLSICDIVVTNMCFKDNLMFEFNPIARIYVEFGLAGLIYFKAILVAFINMVVSLIPYIKYKCYIWILANVVTMFVVFYSLVAYYSRY
jgi:predicted ABC-type exoprotein transport system permease subunit